MGSPVFHRLVSSAILTKWSNLEIPWGLILDALCPVSLSLLARSMSICLLLCHSTVRSPRQDQMKKCPISSPPLHNKALTYSLVWGIILAHRDVLTDFTSYWILVTWFREKMRRVQIRMQNIQKKNKYKFAWRCLEHSKCFSIFLVCWCLSLCNGKSSTVSDNSVNTEFLT